MSEYPDRGPSRAARPRRSARRAAGLLGSAALLSAALTGCSAASTATLPACHSPEAAVLPHTAGSLTQADSGTYCLAAGQTLAVFLTATSTTARSGWSAITVSDTAVLGYGNTGVMTAPIDVTPGMFVGLTRGTATLDSTLPSGAAWKVVIVVS